MRHEFANALRGIAALSVVANHLTGVYWVAPALVAATTFTTAPSAPRPAFASLSGNAWYNLGPFGVALFFLISGFVIPISIERQRATSFLVARAFRIFPTYVAGLAIGVAVLLVNAHHWQHAFSYTPAVVAANALLVCDIVDRPSIDLVNWTLMVELKFYVLIALLSPFVRRGSIAALLAVAATITLVTTFSHQIFLVIPGLGRVLRIFESNALYLLYMLIGVVFSFRARGRIGKVPAGLTIAVLFGLFVYCWPRTFFRAEYPSATYNYGWALIAFSAAYALRRSIPKLPVADFFAAISYPLYVVHSLVGYTILTLLIGAGVNAAVATLAALGAVVTLAFVLHATIEVRSQAFGKALAARLGSPPSSGLGPPPVVGPPSAGRRGISA